MATTIAIICTLDELIPYSLIDPTKFRYFSAHLSVGLRGDAALPGAAEKLLQPWLLSSVTLQFYGDKGAAGAQPAGTTIATISVDKKAVDCSQIGAALSQRLAAAVAANDGGYFLWSDEPNAKTLPVPGENWARVLAHASTYPAPVPHSLNLAFHFKVDVGELTGITRLFVAPTVVADSNTFAPGTDPDQPDANSMVAWQYVVPHGSLPVAAYQPEYALAALPAGALPAPHFIDRNTYWVGTSDGKDQISPPESNASEDWRTSLEFKAGEAFDLGQRMIVALRTQFFPGSGYTPLSSTRPSYADVDAMAGAVLAALHDTADFGLRYGPDGTNLFRFILQRVTDVALPSAAVVDALEEALIGVPPMSLGAWTAAIQKLGVPTTPLGISAPTDKTVPATGDYVRATLDMLDTVQKALSIDDNLATLVMDQWNQQLGNQASWTSLSSAVAKAIAALPTSRTLRTRYLLANMGGVAQLPPGLGVQAQPADPSVPIWSALTVTGTGVGTTFASEQNDVTNNLKNLLAAYFQGRFGIASTDANAKLFAHRAPLAQWPVDGTGLPVPDLTSALKDDAGKFASNVLFPVALSQPTRASHAVIIQVDESSDDSTVKLQEDVARKFAGMGLLVREGRGLWSCAN